MAEKNCTEPAAAESLAPNLDDVDPVGRPIFESFTWHTDEERLAENRNADRDVRRLEMAEDIFGGNAVLAGVLESELTDLTDHKLFSPAELGALMRYLIAVNGAAAKLLAVDRDLHRSWAAEKELRAAERREAALRDFEARR